MKILKYLKWTLASVFGLLAAWIAGVWIYAFFHAVFIDWPAIDKKADLERAQGLRAPTAIEQRR